MQKKQGQDQSVEPDDSAAYKFWQTLSSQEKFEYVESLPYGTIPVGGDAFSVIEFFMEQGWSPPVRSEVELSPGGFMEVES